MSLDQRYQPPKDNNAISKTSQAFYPFTSVDTVISLPSSSLSSIVPAYRNKLPLVALQVELLLSVELDINYPQMQDDLRRGLVSKKGSAFEKMSEECLVKIQRIRQKNDLMQKQIGTDEEQSISEEIHNQQDYLEKEISALKTLLLEMENKFKDPESRNRLKQIKTDAQKQIERNKVILKDLVNRSFVRRSGGRTNPEGEQNQKYLEGGKVDYDKLGGKKTQPSQLTEEVEIDYEIERKIMLEKNELIGQVEQSANRINDIMNDMGVMVDEQGNNLDIITEELVKVDNNMQAAQENIEDANTYQKKSRKKYVFMVALIILIVFGAVGLVFLLTD